MKPKYWNKGVDYLSNKDRVLRAIIKKFPEESLKLNSNHYHALLNSIIGQQISVPAANAIKNRFFNLHKNITPSNVLKFKEISFINCGLSKQKILYIKNISTYFKQNKIFFKTINLFTDSEIKERLVSVKGIGNWTADMFLLFSSGSSNIFPSGDLGFIKAIAKHYKKNIPIDYSYLEILEKKWSPYSSIATWYLWRSLDPIPVSY